MGSHSLLPHHNIKLEPTCETGHVHNSAKEMTTDVKVFDMVDSKPSVRIKTEQPDEDVEYPGQDEKTLTCSQNVPSLPVQKDSQMEMMMSGHIESLFVKQELSDILCEDKSHTFGKVVGMMNCSSDLKMSGNDNIGSRIIQNSHEALRELGNCSHISENVSSMLGVNTKDSLMDTNCQLQTNVGKKTLNKADSSDICNESVSVVSILDRQERKYTEEKRYKCDDCGASFTRAGNLKSHMRTHTGEKPYMCDDCGASFTRAGSLKIHKRTHTGEKPYMCDACGACFTMVESLKIHERNHTGEEPYKCYDCDASFTQAGSLKTHRRIHTGERPYKCYDCGASFTQGCNLKKHKRIHTGERPYRCDACDASFTEASSLNRHKKTHTGERPYKCDTCDSSFTEAGSLKKHKRTHTGERPYKCDDCGASFTRADHLKTHKLTHEERDLSSVMIVGYSLLQQ